MVPEFLDGVTLKHQIAGRPFKIEIPLALGVQGLSDTLESPMFRSSGQATIESARLQ